MMFRVKSKISRQDIFIFLEQLANIIDAGIPINQALNLIHESHNNKAMRVIIWSIKHELEYGLSLKQTLSKYPQYFSISYINLIAVGETSNSLAKVLREISNNERQRYEFWIKVKKSCYYPIFLLFVTLIITVVFLLQVIPMYKNMFASLGAPLPLLTQNVIYISYIVTKFWHFFVAIFITIILVFKLAINSSPPFHYAVSNFVLNLPIIGDFKHSYCRINILITMTIAIKAEIKFEQALYYASQANNCPVYHLKINNMISHLSNGRSIQQSFPSCNFFPPLIKQFITSGATSGNLDTMLEKITNLYKIELESKLSLLDKLFAPLLISLVSIFIGIVIYAMYLPILSIGDHL